MTGTPDFQARKKANALKDSGAKPMRAFLYVAAYEAIVAGDPQRDSHLTSAAARHQKSAGRAVVRNLKRLGREKQAKEAASDYGVAA